VLEGGEMASLRVPDARREDGARERRVRADIAAALGAAFSYREVHLEEGLVLLNAGRARAGSGLARVLSVLAHLEPASHLLFWGRSYRSASGGRGLWLEHVELPRLAQSFDVRRRCGGEGLALCSNEHADYSIPSALPDTFWDLVRQLPEGVPLTNAKGDVFVLAPSCAFQRPKVHDAPFHATLFRLRTISWYSSPTRVFKFPVQPFGYYLSSPETGGLCASLYLFLHLLLKRNYSAAAEALRLCPSTVEESFFSSSTAEGLSLDLVLPPDVKADGDFSYGGLDDAHPSAAGLQCKLLAYLCSLVAGSEGLRRAPSAGTERN
jgi:hypothetical protein